MTVSRQDLINIRNITRRYRLISDRVAALNELGYNIKCAAMGSGGVGQVKETKKEIRVQISHGVSRWNYAYCVVFGK